MASYKEMTTQEFADALGVPKPVAYNLLQYLEKTAIVSRLEQKRTPAGKAKGPGEVVYKIPHNAGDVIQRDLTRIFFESAEAMASVKTE